MLESPYLTLSSSDDMWSDEEKGSSEVDHSAVPLKLEDIFPFYDTEPETDKETYESIRQMKITTMQTVINRINRSIQKISDNWPNATPLQIYVGFVKSLNDPDELIFRVKNNPKFLQDIIEEEKALKLTHQTRPIPKTNLSQREEESGSDTETDDTYNAYVHPDKISPKKKKQRQKKGEVTKTKLICPSDVDKDIWATWSEAHRHSYLVGMKNPNTYLYRNCPPGEEHKTGPFTEEEKVLFLKRLEEMKPIWEKAGSAAQWGIFSKSIPGRVGYQCSNFYRKLVQSGEITDDDYSIGPDGRWHYKERGMPKSEKMQKSPREKKVKTKSIYEKMAENNPLPGITDDITKEEIKVPAMSPDGYVLDYSTWLNILKESRENPFTRNHLKKRQLVILTRENIDEYRDQIKNL